MEVWKWLEWNIFYFVHLSIRKMKLKNNVGNVNWKIFACDAIKNMCLSMFILRW